MKTRVIPFVVSIGVATVLAGCFVPVGSPEALTLTVNATNYAYEATLGFGDVDIEAGPLTHSGVLTNVVDMDVTVTGYETGSPFSIDGPAVPFTVGAGESIDISLSFDPDIVGEAAGSLEILLEGLSEPFVLNLTGSGTGTAAKLLKVTIGDIDYASGDTCDIGACEPDDASSEQAIRLVNMSDGPISVTGVTTGSAGISLQLPDLPFTVQDGADVPATIGFDPTVTGEAHAQFDLTVEHASGVFTLNVSGLGDYSPTASEAIVVSGAGSIQANGTYYRSGERNGWPAFKNPETGYRIYAVNVEGPEWYLEYYTDSVWITLYDIPYSDFAGDTGPSTVPGVSWQVVNGTLPAPTSVGPFTMDRPSAPWVGDTIVASYVFDDVEGDSEGTSLYQWYSCDTPDGTYIPIDGATETNYTTTGSDVNLFLKFEVVPYATTGTEVGDALMIGPTPAILPPAPVE